MKRKVEDEKEHSSSDEEQETKSNFDGCQCTEWEGQFTCTPEQIESATQNLRSGELMKEIKSGMPRKENGAVSLW